VAKRQSDVLRNLDDTLKLFGVISLRSCGLVIMFFSVAFGLEWGLKIWSLLFGSLAILTIVAVTAVMVAALAIVENREDEHLVPSAIRYYLKRQWRVVYSGARNDGFAGRSLEEVLGGGGR